MAADITQLFRWINLFGLKTILGIECVYPKERVPFGWVFVSKVYYTQIYIPIYIFMKQEWVRIDELSPYHEGKKKKPRPGIEHPCSSVGDLCFKHWAMVFLLG